MNKIKVAFIGLGVMGYPMAGHLTQKGYSVTVHNRNVEKANKWREEFGGSIAATPGQAAEGANFVFLCVGNDDDVRDVILSSSGVLTKMQKGGVIIDHTTASAKLARQIGDEAQKRGISFLDAPVSGGGGGAQKGILSIMVGGDEIDFNRALPLMKCYGASINLMGGIGSGQLTKMVNQICIVGALQGVAEALNFGLDAGLDMEKVITVISKGAAQSWQLENRGPWMLSSQYEKGGFVVDLIKKDLGLVIEEAKNQVQNIAVKALESASGAKALSHVNQIAIEQALNAFNCLRAINFNFHLRR